jgi:hypothetical protein
VPSEAWRSARLGAREPVRRQLGTRPNSSTWRHVVWQDEETLAARRHLDRAVAERRASEFKEALEAEGFWSVTSDRSRLRSNSSGTTN